MAVALVTGANRGIGLELCRQLKARGDTVIGACRGTSAALAALDIEVLDGVDVSEGDAVSSLAERLGGRQLDLLVNNAGILQRVDLETLDLDSCRRQFEVNALGPLRVTQAVLPFLSEGAKVAIVTSRMGSIADNTSGSHYGYRMSKAAVNIAGVSLARDLAPRGISVALLHPGYVRTGMTRGQGYVEPAEAATGLIARIDALSLSTTGGFWHANGERLPW